jgi:hypothetical protein
MRRILIENENKEDLRVTILVEPTEFDPFHQNTSKYVNASCENDIILNKIVPNEIGINKKAFELIKSKSNEESGSIRDKTALLILDGRIRVNISKKDYGKLDKYKNLSIVVKKGSYGFKKDALFNQIEKVFLLQEKIKGF